MNKFLSNKKAVVGVVIAAVVVIGGIIGGVSYHNVQVAKEKAEAEKKAKDHLEELTKEFDTAKFQIENAIIEDTERTTLLESLNGYEKKLDGISKEDEKEFDTLRTSIEGKYTASAAILEDVVGGIATAYPTEEGYYTEEFTASVNALMDELNTLKADGKYQEAFNKFNEINGTYAAYVEKVNAEKAAAEEAAKKAEQEKAKAENNKKSSNSSAKNSNGGSNSGSGSSSSANTSGSASASSDSSSSNGKTYSESDETLARNLGFSSAAEMNAATAAAKAQANAQGYPAMVSNSTAVPPDSWTTNQFLDWCKENGLY